MAKAAQRAARITRCGYNVDRDCLFVFREDYERKFYEPSKPLHDAIIAYGAARGEGDEWRALVEAAVKTSKEVDWGNG